jgi:hypothetical protein
MPAMTMGPPPAGSYNYVVRRNEIVAEGNDAQPIALHAYEEVQNSRCVHFQGQSGHYLFIRNENAWNRACRLGWEDVTEAWMTHLKTVTPAASTPGQQSILGAMSTEWMSKRDIVGRCGLPDSEWRTAIKTLLERGLVECNFGSKQRKSASNRRYLYRLTA